MSGLPPSAPFSPDQWQQLQPLLHALDSRQSLWLSGYLAASPQPAAETPPAAREAAPAILVAHGGETGNSASVARQLAERATAAGLSVQLEDLADLRLRQLKKVTFLVLVCSTHGDGDPPEPVIPFHEALMSESAPSLPDLRYAVLALGDTSYEHFCATGREFDQRLASLGATRLLERRECDLDFQPVAEAWIADVLPCLPVPQEASSPGSVSHADAFAQTARQSVPDSTRRHDKQNPKTVEVLENLCLSPGRDLHHIELLQEGDPLPLEPGDAVGVLADNPPGLVRAVLEASGLPADSPVSLQGHSRSLVEALRRDLDLTIPGQRLLAYWAEISGAEALSAQVAATTAEQRKYLRSVQVLDLLQTYPLQLQDAQAFVDVLRPLQPRLYDLANDPAGNDELHLTVKLSRYPFAGRMETGIASRYLLDLGEAEPLAIYPHRNARFHLPEDPALPLILVGEGTGVAPYRAFLQRLAREGGRRCWLVLAEQSFEEDFLYQLDWQRARNEGLLERVDTVFYADQPGCTLGTRLMERAGALREWLAAGAHIYFCGDKTRLSACEKALTSGVPDIDWRALGKAKRIHRNLY